MSRQTDPHYPQIVHPIVKDQHMQDILLASKQRIDKHSAMIEDLQTLVSQLLAQVAALQNV